MTSYLGETYRKVGDIISMKKSYPIANINFEITGIVFSIGQDWDNLAPCVHNRTCMKNCNLSWGAKVTNITDKYKSFWAAVKIQRTYKKRLRRRHSAAIKIQTALKRSMANPAYFLCRRRLDEEFNMIDIEIPKPKCLNAYMQLM